MARCGAAALLVLLLAAVPLASAQKPKLPKLHNWNWGFLSKPGAFKNATSAQDVIDVVKDAAAYRSPVLPVGSMHSVTDLIVNNKGTVIAMGGMNKILGFDPATMQVRVEAGMELADLHDYLGQQGYELSFSPEIGDATVGSLVGSTSKDSSIEGPGYLSALVKEVKYVDATGATVTLKAGADDAALTALHSCYSLCGVVVEVVLQARPQALINTTPAIVRFAGSSRADYEAAATQLMKLKQEADNIFFVTAPGYNLSLVEQRFKLPDQSAAQSLAESASNQQVLKVIQNLKFQLFLVGGITADIAQSILPLVDTVGPVYHYRRDFVNRYPPVTKKQSRLDFSYFEYQDVSQFVDVYASAMEFIRDYKAKSKFAPTCLATYFVSRVEGKPAGSNYGGGPGTSFMLDPINNNPSSPQWLKFLDAFNAFASGKGAVLSLSQTKRAPPAKVALIPKDKAQARFTTLYFQKYVG